MTDLIADFSYKSLQKRRTAKLTDNQTDKNTQNSLAALLRQLAYSRLAGYEDSNDAEWDQKMRRVIVLSL